jgi:cell division septation protein DedD
MAQEARGGVLEGMRRFVTGAALLGIGCSIGLVVGTVSNVPELLLAWAASEGTTVELAAREVAPTPTPRVADLQEFPKLQEPAKAQRAAASAPLASNPQVASPPPAAQPWPAAPPPAAAPGPEPAAKQSVVASLARKAAPPAPGAAVVQVASYSDARAADALVRRLRGQGFDSYVSDQKPDGQQRYRVRVRPAAGQDPKQLAAKLGQSGLSVWVTRE